MLMTSSDICGMYPCKIQRLHNYPELEKNSAGQLYKCQTKPSIAVQHSHSQGVWLSCKGRKSTQTIDPLPVKCACKEKETGEHDEPGKMISDCQNV
jgi:hypothetical protein